MLKPNEEIITGALTAIAVYGIFQLNTPNLADVQASAPGGGASVTTHGSVKTAAWTSAVFVAGISLLAKDPTVFIIGALVTVAESWKFFHANVTAPGATGSGMVLAPGANASGQPAPTLMGNP